MLFDWADMCERVGGWVNALDLIKYSLQARAVIIFVVFSIEGLDRVTTDG